jgi:cobalt/nickel transport system permease protein
MSALMLLAMTVEIGFMDYHVNLTVLAGILLGPAGGFLAAFIANLFSAFVGHGGLTVIGLNATLNGLEAVGGAALFGVFRRVWPDRPALAAGAATFPDLAFFATLRLLILRWTGVFSAVVGKEGGAAHLASTSFRWFAASVYLFGSLGWAIETVLVGGIVAFLAKARPTLLSPKGD